MKRSADLAQRQQESFYSNPIAISISATSEAPLVREHCSSQTEERWAQYGIILLVIYATARAVVSSIAKPFWFDEINTWIISRQPGIAAIWGALRRGADSQPILFSLIERAASAIPNAEIGFRLPSVIGFACVLVCIFVFVRRRSNGIYGLISAAILLLTALYMPYAIEARPYQLVSACVAVAMVAYQRAHSVRWAVLMGFALAIAESLSYYAVFAIVAFLAAEAAFLWKTSIFRPRIWVALIFGASPLAAFWPLLARFKAFYGQNFWAQPTFWALRDTYGHFLQVSSFLGLAISAVCGLAVLGNFAWMRDEPAEEFTEGVFHERILIFFLLAGPLIVFVVAKLAHGGYVDRYALFSVLGISSAIGLVLSHLGRPTLIVFSALLLLGIVAQEGSFWFSKKTHWHVQSPAPMAERMLSKAGYTNLPVVVIDTHEYLQLAYYAPQPLAARLFAVVDAHEALRYTNSDSDDKFLPVLATCFPLRVEEFQVFHSAFPSFLLYASADQPLGWWPDRLVHDGYRLRIMDAEQGNLVFLVTSPNSNLVEGASQ